MLKAAALALIAAWGLYVVVVNVPYLTATSARDSHFDDTFARVANQQVIAPETPIAADDCFGLFRFGLDYSLNDRYERQSHLITAVLLLVVVVIAFPRKVLFGGKSAT